MEGAVLAENNESRSVDQETALDIEHIKKRLEMLDQRLDNVERTLRER